jgi:hypothetical protein
VPDLALVALPRRTELRAALRGRLGQLGRGLRPLAENVLGAEERIDFVAVDADGCTALVLVAEPGRELERLAEALAQRAWVGARLADWRQLAPEIPLRPEAGIRLVVLVAEIGPRFRAVASALGGDAPEVWLYRCVRNGAGLDVLLEPQGRDGEPSSPSRDRSPTAAFRSGLSDAQLGLTPEEIAEFD